MSDNRYYVQLQFHPAIRRCSRWLASQILLDVNLELLDHRYPLRSRLDNFRLELEDLASVLRCQYADRFPNLPTWRTQDLESLRTLLKHGHDRSAAHADSIRISFKGVEVETSGIKSLQDFSGIGHAGGWRSDYILYRPRSSSFKFSSHFRIS